MKPAETLVMPTKQSQKSAPGLPLVLIADDDDDNRQMYVGYLRANGFRVVEAHDGAEASKLAKQLLPAILVLDLHMPRVDGIAATRRICRDPKTRNTPILVLTAYDAQEQDALEAGANVVCVKPYIYDELLARIQRLLRRNPAGS